MTAYKIWHQIHARFPRLSKFTLGGKIDALFSDVIETLLSAGFAPREQKPDLIRLVATKLDALKFFLQVAWELRCIDNNSYATLSTSLQAVGKMIGGWQRDLKTKAAPTTGVGAAP